MLGIFERERGEFLVSIEFIYMVELAKVWDENSCMTKLEFCCEI